MKKVEKTYQNGDQLLTILESGFSLVPDSPWLNDPDFRTNWEKGNETKWRVQFIARSSGDGKETLVFNNYFVDENGRKPSLLKTFHITTDSLLARQLIRENILQKGKKFFLVFSKVANYDKILNCWYFDSSCDRKIWIDEISRV